MVHNDEAIIIEALVFKEDEKGFADTPTNNKGNKIFTLYLHNMFQP
jgi:hypothetical protein